MRSTELGIVVAVAALGLAHPVQADNKARVAVLDFGERNVPPGTGALVADVLRAELDLADDVDPVRWERLNTVVAEHVNQSGGPCYSAACAARIGQLLNVPFAWSGTLTKYETGYVLVMEVVNAGTAEVERTTRVLGETVDDLLHQTIEATHSLPAWNPVSASGFVKLGQWFIHREEYRDAAEVFAQAILRHPSNPEVWSKRAEVLEQLGRYDEANAASQEARWLTVPDTMSDYWPHMRVHRVYQPASGGQWVAEVRVAGQAYLVRRGPPFHRKELKVVGIDKARSCIEVMRLRDEEVHEFCME